MPEIVIPDKYTDQIPRFTLPQEFSNEAQTPPAPADKAEAKPESAPETPPKEEAKAQAEEKPEEKETTGKDPEKATTRRFERRIDRAVRAKAEAQAKAELLEKELAEIKARQSQPQIPSGAPKPEDFTDVEDYAKAREKWAVDQALKERDTQAIEEEKKRELAEISSSWDQQMDKGADKYDDFAEVVGDLKPTTEWAIAIMQQDNAADVAYYLGKHEKEAERIIGLHPRKQHQEIARISARLSQAVEPPKPSKAPEPIKPIQGAAETSEADPFKPQSYEDYLKSLKKAPVHFVNR